MSQSTTDRQGARAQLERLTVNLTPRTQDALERTTSRSGDSKTDALNRAVQIYDFLEEVWMAGGQVFVQREPGSAPEAIRFF